MKEKTLVVGVWALIGFIFLPLLVEAIFFSPAPGRALLEDGCEPDLLGLFIGSALAESGGSPLPPQILLFLENLWDMAEGDENTYRHEIRTTYLHELGHYLGLDELDLEERGLD